MKFWLLDMMVDLRKEERNTSELDKKLNVVLKERFGFTEFKNDKQRNATMGALRGRADVFISFPRNRGRSMCYLLPAVMQASKITLVFCPSVGRIEDKLEYLGRLGIQAVTINSEMSQVRRTEIINSITSSMIRPNFIYATPDQMSSASFEKLFYFLKYSELLAYLVLDESYHESEWDHPELKKHYDELGRFRQEQISVQWIILTTFTNDKVVESIAKKVHLDITNYEFGKLLISSFRTNLVYDVIVHDTLSMESVKQFIEKQNIVESMNGHCLEIKKNGLIFCRTEETADNISSALRSIGVEIGSYHAGLTREAQSAAINMFMDGRLQVLAVTSSFGTSINSFNIKFVIHWDLPTSMENYYKETSLAGKDGNPAKCRIFSTGQSLFAFNQQIVNTLINEPEKVNIATRSYIEFLHSGTADIQYDTIRCIHGIFAQYDHGKINENTISCKMCQF